MAGAHVLCSVAMVPYTDAKNAQKCIFLSFSSNGLERAEVILRATGRLSVPVVVSPVHVHVEAGAVLALDVLARVPVERAPECVQVPEGGVPPEPGAHLEHPPLIRALELGEGVPDRDLGSSRPDLGLVVARESADVVP